MSPCTARTATSSTSCPPASTSRGATPTSRRSRPCSRGSRRRSHRDNLVVLRIPSILAVAASCCSPVAVRAAARWRPRRPGADRRGGRRVRRYTMTVGHRLSTATFDTLAWTAILVVVTQAAARPTGRGCGCWPALVAGIGLNNKHAVVFCLLGAILVGVALVRGPGRCCAPGGPGSVGLARARDVGPQPALAGRRTTGRSSSCPPTSPRSTAGSVGRIELVGAGPDHVQPADRRGRGSSAWSQLLRRPEWVAPGPGARRSWW